MIPASGRDEEGAGGSGAGGGDVGSGVSVVFEVGNMPVIEVVLVVGVGVDNCPNWDFGRTMMLLIGISAIVPDRTRFVKFLAMHRPSISHGRGQASISGRQHQSLPRQWGEI